MSKYTDDDIRNMKKVTCQAAGEYLGISSTAVAMGLRNNLLPISFTQQVYHSAIMNIIVNVENSL